MSYRKRLTCLEVDETFNRKPLSFETPSILWPSRLNIPHTLEAAAIASIMGPLLSNGEHSQGSEIAGLKGANPVYKNDVMSKFRIEKDIQDK